MKNDQADGKCGSNFFHAVYWRAGFNTVYVKIHPDVQPKLHCGPDLAQGCESDMPALKSKKSGKRK